MDEVDAKCTTMRSIVVIYLSGLLFSDISVLQRALAHLYRAEQTINSLTSPLGKTKLHCVCMLSFPEFQLIVEKAATNVF